VYYSLNALDKLYYDFAIGERNIHDEVLFAILDNTPRGFTSAILVGRQTYKYWTVGYEVRIGTTKDHKYFQYPRIVGYAKDILEKEELLANIAELAHVLFHGIVKEEQLKRFVEEVLEENIEKGVLFEGEYGGKRYCVYITSNIIEDPTFRSAVGILSCYLEWLRAVIET